MQVEGNWWSQVNQELITSQAKSGRPGRLPPMLTSFRTIKCRVESSGHRALDVPAFPAIFDTYSKLQ